MQRESRSWAAYAFHTLLKVQHPKPLSGCSGCWEGKLILSFDTQNYKMLVVGLLAVREVAQSSIGSYNLYAQNIIALEKVASEIQM